MRKTITILILSVIGFAATLAGFGQPAAPLTPDFSQPLSDTEIAHLTYMLEEEKLARDVYSNLYETWGVPAFANIAAAEQRHLESVQWVMQNYGMEPLVLENGKFVEPVLAALYSELMASGAKSELDALKVGGLIEEVDIADLAAALEETQNPILQNVFGNLMRGSRNHLRAFAGLIEAQGIEYEAQYMAPEDVDTILDSPRERGRRGNSFGCSGSCGLNGGAGMGPKNTGGKAGPGGNSGSGPKGPGAGSGPGDGSCQN